MNDSTSVPTGRLIPYRVKLDGDWLTWDPWKGRALVEAPAMLAGIGDLDAFAAIARPATDKEWRALVLSWARRWGPLSWCSTCGRQHHLDWRMEAPPPLKGGSRPHGTREPLADWQAAAEHVNALRRVAHRLRATPGLPDDWNTVWPDHPGGLARGPDPDLIAEDNRIAEEAGMEQLERASAPWGDRRWERQQVAGHLTSWLVSCHVGQVVRWDGDDPIVGANAGSLLGEIGALVAQSLRTRIRSCEGAVWDRPCRITWDIVRDKPRDAPMLCTGCYALYRQRQAQSRRKGEPQ